MKDRYILVVVLAVVCTVWSEDEWQDCTTKEVLRLTSTLKAIAANRDFDSLYAKEDLDLLCPIVNRAMRCLDSFTREFMMEEELIEFNLLFQGPIELLKKLCQPGPYQEDFLTHALCLKQAEDSYGHCVLDFEQKVEDFEEKVDVYVQKIEELDARFTEGLMGITETLSMLSEIRTACCSIRDYLACVNREVMQICGEQTAKFSDDLINQAFPHILKEMCDNFDLSQCSAASRNFARALPFP